MQGRAQCGDGQADGDAAGTYSHEHKSSTPFLNHRRTRTPVKGSKTCVRDYSAHDGVWQVCGAGWAGGPRQLRASGRIRWPGGAARCMGRVAPAGRAGDPKRAGRRRHLSYPIPMVNPDPVSRAFPAPVHRDFHRSLGFRLYDSHPYFCLSGRFFEIYTITASKSPHYVPKQGFLTINLV